MNIKPILFSTPMVQAILEGRKTMTRRVVNKDISNQFDVEADGKTIVAYIDQESGDSHRPEEVCRIKQGDILWVRETWMQNEHGYIYKNAEPYLVGKPKWRPSIFMPKAAARFWLKVTDVRCERVNQITNDDAILEGCTGAECDCLHTGRSWMGCESCMNTGWQEPPTLEFMELWEHLNAKRGYAWNSNPWVWVISFERCDKPESEV